MVRLVSWLLLAFVLTIAGQTSAAGNTTYEPGIHTVWFGQRLGSIAKRYNVSVEAICHANGIKPRDTIQAGQKLVIPARDDKTGSRARELRLAGFLDAQLGANSQARQSDQQPGAKSKPKPAQSEDKARKPQGGLRVHEIQRGQRLGSIAKRYQISVDVLCHANAIERHDRIKPGQLLIIPPPDDVGGHYTRRQRDKGALEATLEARGERDGLKQSKRAKTSQPASWKRYEKRPARRGYVNIIGHHKSWKGYVFRKNGTIDKRAHSEISSILTPMGKRPPVDARLVRLLVKVSNTFGGRPLRVVSGYRGSSYVKDSRHKSGRAVDFSVIGVPNGVLRDYLRTLEDVGVGYYPNSTFIHLDVREYSAYWVDYSGPGEAPRYAPSRLARIKQNPSGRVNAPVDIHHDEPAVDAEGNGKGETAGVNEEPASAE